MSGDTFPRGALDVDTIHARHARALAEFKEGHTVHYQRWEANARAFAARFPGREALALELEEDIFGAALAWIERNKKRSFPDRATGPVVDTVACRALEDERTAAAKVAEAYYREVRKSVLAVEERSFGSTSMPCIIMPEGRPTLEQYAELHGRERHFSTYYDSLQACDRGWGCAGVVRVRAEPFEPRQVHAMSDTPKVGRVLQAGFAEKEMHTCRLEPQPAGSARNATASSRGR